MAEGQLKVAYADGSSRIVNLSKDFFTHTEVYNGLLKKRTIITTVEKAKQLAEIYGKRPLSVILTQGGSIVYEKEIEQTEQGQPHVEKVTCGKLKELQGALSNPKPLGTVKSFRALTAWQHGLSA